MNTEARREPNAPTPLGDKFKINLTMISDWHVGSGAGRPGNIDSLVRRDVDDLPYVPAKTLTGIWRDACERVATGLDNGHDKGPWNQWVNHVFGDQPAIRNAELTNLTDPETRSLKGDWRPPNRALLSVRSAHLPDDLRSALQSKPVARDALTFVKAGISIHPRTGSARPDFLRFEEMARGGITLGATCELRHLSGDDRRIVSALLVAGARMVEHLGGKRRRGAGRCDLTIVGFEEVDPWLDWIETHPRPEAPLSERNSFDTIGSGSTTPAEGGWLTLQLSLKTKLPVIIPSGIVGNLIETLDYIPGTYLLPHLTRHLNAIDARAAITRGDLICTNATIEIGGAQGRPVPFSLAYPKTGRGLRDGRDVFNQLCEGGPDTQPKNHREGYVGPTPSPLALLPQFSIIDPSVETHNVVQDRVQRPTEEIGGVYSYQAMPAATVLRAELRLRQSIADELTATDQNWFLKLNSELSVGRASKDDYGLVELRVIGKPAPASAAIMDDPKELTVWLLSDLLMRDERLRPVASIEHLIRALEDKLNEGAEESQKVKLTIREQSESENVWFSFSRQRRTDSWHVGWGLPRPSLVGLRAGTCAVIQVEGDIDPARLSFISAGGLGERRGEGYGQICFNEPLLRSPLSKLQRDKSASFEMNEATFFVSQQSSFEYAHLIETEAVRNEMRRLAPGFAADSQNRRKALGIENDNRNGKPRMSQLGGLASVIRRLQRPSDEASVLRWLQQLKKVKRRAEDWPRDSLDYIEELITNKERVWELLNLEFSKLILTENGNEQLKRELWTEAVRTLVDASVRAHKRDIEGESNNG